MTLKSLLLSLGKLVICGLAFAIGTLAGGMLSTALQLPLPAAPAGADMTNVQIFSIVTTPLLALGLVILSRGLAGSFLTRALVLSFFTWIAYAVNTQLEASIVSTYAAGFWYALVMYLFAALLCGVAVAYFFPPEKQVDARETLREFWARYGASGWSWRLALATVAFMPIYFLFGLMVLPFTGDYYRESMFGLVMPTIETLLPILFIRSVFFLAACLPIVILWQKSDRALLWRLGLALFLLVGFVIMLYADWLPLYVRVPHTLEIFADEFVYAGALVWLLGRGQLFAPRVPKLRAQRTF
jgi:hypothetical protein